MASPHEAKTLGQVLTQRFEELKDTARSVTQSDIADAMGVQQSTLSKIMRDKLDAGRRTPRQVEAMLKGFGYSDREMASLAMRFSLRLPEKYAALYLNNLGMSSPNSAIVQIENVRGTTEGGVLPMPKFILGDHKPERCRYLEIENDVLVCERARAELGKGRILALSLDERPDDGDFAVYRYKGLNKFAVVLYSDGARTIPVSSIDRHDGDVINKNDKRLEFVGVSVGEYSQGRRSALLSEVN